MRGCVIVTSPCRLAKRRPEEECGSCGSSLQRVRANALQQCTLLRLPLARKRNDSAQEFQPDTPILQNPSSDEESSGEEHQHSALGVLGNRSAAHVAVRCRLPKEKKCTAQGRENGRVEGRCGSGGGWRCGGERAVSMKTHKSCSPAVYKHDEK